MQLLQRRQNEGKGREKTEMREQGQNGDAMKKHGIKREGDKERVILALKETESLWAKIKVVNFMMKIHLEEDCLESQMDSTKVWFKIEHNTQHMKNGLH